MTYNRQISSYDIASNLRAQRSAQMAQMFSTFLRSLFARKPAMRPVLG